MKGYRTIIVNILMAAASIAGVYNIDIPPDQVEAIATGVVSVFTVVNLFLRAVTNTPVGSDKPIKTVGRS